MPVVDVSVILVNFNGEEYLPRCLHSMREHNGDASYEVVVVDNASTDRSREILRGEYPDVIVIESEKNTGFSRGNNLGAQRAQGKYLLFLNTDTYFTEPSIKVLSDHLDNHSTVAAVGPMLVFEDGSFQLSAGRLPSILVEFVDKVVYGLDRRWRPTLNGFYRWLFGRSKHTGWITGACMMVRRSAFEQVDGFDEKMFMYFEDKDICKRFADAGWEIAYHSETSVVHLLGGSAAPLQKTLVNTRYRTSQTYYYTKHLGTVQRALLRWYLQATGKS